MNVNTCYKLNLPTECNSSGSPKSNDLLLNDIKSLCNVLPILIKNDINV